MMLAFFFDSIDPISACCEYISLSLLSPPATRAVYSTVYGMGLSMISLSPRTDWLHHHPTTDINIDTSSTSFSPVHL